MTRGEFPFPYNLLSTVSLSLTEWKTAHLTPKPRRVWGIYLCPKVTGFVTSAVRSAGWGGVVVEGEGSRAIPDDWTEKVVLCTSFLRYASFLKFSWVYDALPQVSAGLWLNQVCRPELVQNGLRRGPPPAESHCPYCVQTVIAFLPPRESTLSFVRMSKTEYSKGEYDPLRVSMASTGALRIGGQ